MIKTSEIEKPDTVVDTIKRIKVKQEQIDSYHEIYIKNQNKLLKRLDIFETSIQPKAGKFSLIIDKTTSQGIVIFALTVGVLGILTATMVLFGIDAFSDVLAGLGVLIAPLIYYLGANGGFAKLKEYMNELLGRNTVEEKKDG